MNAKTLSVRVNRVVDEAIDIRSFELVSVDEAPLPMFEPGSHIDVYIEPGLMRQYSLCSGPSDRNRYVIAVKKEAQSRGGSTALHARVREGDVLMIGEPRNNFALDANAKHHTLLAGGIGVTPMLSMAHHLAAAAAPFDLHYFTRSVEHTAFHQLLSTKDLARNVHFHYAVEPANLRPYLRKLLWQRPVDGALYLCGPRPFMDLVEEVAAPTWPPEAVHLEYFVADPRALAGPQGQFQITLARSGGTYSVPAGETITAILAAQGVEVEISCEQGICGTCLTGVLDGIPDHRDAYLTDQEKTANNKMTVCVSRALSPLLVLDL